MKNILIILLFPLIIFSTTSCGRKKTVKYDKTVIETVAPGEKVCFSPEEKECGKIQITEGMIYWTYKSGKTGQKLLTAEDHEFHIPYNENDQLKEICYELDKESNKKPVRRDYTLTERKKQK